MIRKKKLSIGIISILAFAMGLVACSNADAIEEKPVEQPVVEPTKSEDNIPEEENKINYTGELFAPKASPVVYPVATLQYAGGSTITMNSSGDNSEILGLDSSVFTVNAGNANANRSPGLNTDGSIRLYFKANDETRSGSYFIVTVNEGYSIVSIVIDFIQNEAGARIIANDVDVSLTDGKYVINASSFKVQNGYVGDSSDSKQVHIRSVQITYTGPSAQELIEDHLETSQTLSYNYSFDGDGAADRLNKTNTRPDGTGYSEWTDLTLTSGVTYAGYSGGANNSIQLSNDSKSHPAVFTTGNEYDYDAKKVVVRWNSNTTNGKKIDIYGKNTQYTSKDDLYNDSTKGTKIGSLTYDSGADYKESSLVIETSYKYLAIRAYNSAVYLDSILICWDVAFEYSNTAIRFGGFISASLWNRLESESDIQGYGVILSSSAYLGAFKIEQWYANNDLDEVSAEGLGAAIATACGANTGAVKNFYTELTAEKLHPAEANAEQKGALEGDYYIWNLYKGVSLENLKKEFVAVAYIRINTQIVFLDEVKTSVKGLANSLIDSGAYADTVFDGSLANLAYID